MPGTASRDPCTSISLRDFYQRDGIRFGHVQSVGLDASYGVIVQYLKEWFDRSAGPGLRPLRGLVRVPAFLAAQVFGDAKISRGFSRTFPIRRTASSLIRRARAGFARYTISDELVARRAAFRTMLRSIRGWRRSFSLYANPELSLSHSCGTLRFGSHPATSVLDPSCRAHSVLNLHVADASFMPTSTGINPSLTIAANALRVADAICAEFDSSDRSREQVRAAGAGSGPPANRG